MFFLSYVTTYFTASSDHHHGVVQPGTGQDSRACVASALRGIGKVFPCFVVAATVVKVVADGVVVEEVALARREIALVAAADDDRLVVQQVAGSAVH